MRNIDELAAQKDNNSELEIICMEDIDMKPIHWLWPGRIACGKITVMAGDPGLGKSQTAAAISAIVTKGGGWPDIDIPDEAGNVLILSAEDDAADTIKPRLIAAGADMKRCHVLQAVKTFKAGKEGTRNFDLTQDVDRLGAALKKIGNVRLVIIDPISAYLGGTDSHNNADMRGLLAPLSTMAGQYGVAILLVTHLNKSKEQDFLMRVIGSIGLVAASRASYGVIKDKEKPDIRYFVPLKNNIGNDKDGFAFHIESVTLREGIKTSKICWYKNMVDAHKILNPEGKSETNGAQEFLQELLSGGTVPANDIYDQGEGAGYSKSALQRAANRLKVIRKKKSMKGGWVWSLPQGAG